MTERLDLWGGGWWRFSRYEICGAHVGPACDASLEFYDPWNLYYRSQVDSGIQAPYQSFLRLGAELRQMGGEAMRTGLNIDEVASPLILDWCGHFGLVGILPHSAIRIDLPDRFLAGVQHPVRVLRGHTRAGGRWSSNRKATLVSETLLEGSSEGMQRLGEEIRSIGRSYPTSERETTKQRLKQVLAELMGVPLKDVDSVQTACHDRDWPLGRFVVPEDAAYTEASVLFDSDITSPEASSVVKSRPISALVNEFFPTSSGVPQCFECPLPLSADFWSQYYEPIAELRRSAVSFYFAALHAMHAGGVGALEAFIQPAGICLFRGPDDRLKERWLCPSLLSSFGRMLVQDLAGGKRLLMCEACERPFVTDNYQSRYCTRQCGFKIRQRRLRAKASAKKDKKNRNAKETRKR